MTEPAAAMLGMLLVGVVLTTAGAVTRQTPWQVVESLWQLLHDATAGMLRRRDRLASIPVTEKRPVLDGPDVASTPDAWCRCGSTTDPVEVTVTYDTDTGPEVVARLCPDCRERRQKPGRVSAWTPEAAERAEYALRAEVRAAATITRPDRLVVATPDSALDRMSTVEVRDLLRRKVAKIDALSERWQHEGTAFTLTRQQHDEYRDEIRQVEALRDYLEVRGRFEAAPQRVVTLPSAGMTYRSLPVPARVQIGPIAPERPVEIEQGGWIYSLYWHTPIEEVADCDHEWESIQTMQSTAPLVEVCTVCEVRRRPAGRPTPLHVRKPTFDY